MLADFATVPVPVPVPVTVTVTVTVTVPVSRDGGNTWTTKQVTPAVSNVEQGFRQGCTTRTDSKGVIYLSDTHFAAGTPGHGAHTMIKSFDGGHTWTRPVDIFGMNDVCFNIDPVIGRCVEDDIAGARNDLSAMPSVDAANGAAIRADATDEIVDVWAEGRRGLNREHVMVGEVK
jgi:hypothetical protein